MNKNIIFIILIIVFFAGGIGLGYLFFNKTCPNLELTIDENNTYEAGWKAAKDRLIETGYTQPVNKDIGITEISGTVSSIEGNKIYVKIIPFDILDSPELDERIAVVNNNTEILKMVEKDIDQYKKEMDEYIALVNEGGLDPNSSDFPLAPNRYKEQVSALPEIKVNGLLSVEAGENIRDKKEFSAIKILIQP